MPVRIIRSKDETEIYAEAVGDPSLPLSIVFIHGLGLSSIVFEKLFQDRTLLENAYLVRYDLRGHGWSGKPTDAEAHESKRYAEDFMAVVVEFNLKKPYLFGWSLGATVATDLSDHIQPIPLSGIIFAAPLPYVHLPLMLKLSKPSIAPVRDALQAPDAATVMDAKIKFVHSTFINPKAVDYPTMTSWIGSGAYITGEGIRQAITRPQNPDALHKAGQDGLPLLMLYSHEDAQLNNEVVVDDVCRFFKNKKVVVIPEGGHAVFYDNQSLVVAEIVSFIKTKY
ncbi:alpha beta-hydrolase [Phlebopus sp. FC_14]|nr:alpha beta-hydrolase [Phlebopus sp. FC_14]